MKTNCKYFIVVIALAVISCSDKTATGNVGGVEGEQSVLNKLFGTNKNTELDAPEYLAYCENEENGLTQSKQIGDLIYTSFNKPIAYMILKEQSNKGTLSVDSFAKQKAEYGNLDYFSFRISSDTYNDELLKYKLNSESEYAARIEYFSFKMQNDFELVCGKDTVNPALFHFERVFGLAPYATLIMAFETNNYKGSKKIIYNDRVFNNGLIVLDYNETILKQIPKLKSYEK